MSYTKLAYTTGKSAALEQFGLKTSGMLGSAAGMVGKGLNWGGKAIGTLTGPLGGAISGVGGAVQGLANGEGMKGALARGAMNFATGSIPGGLGVAAGMAGDMAMNKMLAPKPPPMAMTP